MANDDTDWNSSRIKNISKDFFEDESINGALLIQSTELDHEFSSLAFPAAEFSVRSGIVTSNPSSLPATTHNRQSSFVPTSSPNVRAPNAPSGNSSAVLPEPSRRPSDSSASTPRAAAAPASSPLHPLIPLQATSATISADIFSRWEPPSRARPLPAFLRRFTQCSTHRETVEHDPRKAVENLSAGQTCALEVFRSVPEKMQLLEAALDSRNGHVVFRVLSFVDRTLEWRVLRAELQRSQLQYAARQLLLLRLSNAAEQRDRFAIVQDFEGLLSASDLQYFLMQNVARILSGTGTESKLTALKRMQQSLELLPSLQSLASPVPVRVAQLVAQLELEQRLEAPVNALVQSQLSALGAASLAHSQSIAHDELAWLARYLPRSLQTQHIPLFQRPALTALYYFFVLSLIPEKLQAKDRDEMRDMFKTSLNVTPRQLSLIRIEACAARRCYTELEGMIQSKNLLQTIAAARRLASSASNLPPVEPERIAAVVANWIRMRTTEAVGADAVADSGAAEQLVERCLARVSDTEYRVALARRLEAHKIIVDSFAEVGDFSALQKYISTQMKADSPQYNYALEIFHKTASKQGKIIKK